jgi:hypothetical protein
MNKRESTKGNVLFLILIAVALFAGLSYVISQSTRSGSGQNEREWIKMVQAQLDNITLSLGSTVMRHQFKTDCKLQDILDNFCPQTMACGGIADPICNIVSSNDPNRPALNWASGNLVQLAGGEYNDRVNVTLWGGPAISASIMILLVAYEVEDSTAYRNFAYWRGMCTEINEKAGLPEPDDVAALAANDKNDLYIANAMNGPVCELDLAATPDKIKLSYPLSQDGYY